MAVESPNRFGVLPDVHDDFLRDLDTVLDTVDDDMDDSLLLDRELQHARGGGECHTTLVQGRRHVWVKGLWANCKLELKVVATGLLLSTMM